MSEPDVKEFVNAISKMSIDDIRQRAQTVLREGRYKLADEVLGQSELDFADVIENLRVYQAELEIQNEELRRSQNLNQEALARFTSFFNSLPVAELVVDHKGLVMEANLAAQSQFNLKNAHLQQHFFARLIDEADRDLVVDAWAGLSRNQPIDLPEIRFRGGLTGGFIGDLHIAPLPASADEDRHFVCAVIDRTEAVTQRRALHDSGERLRRSEADLRLRLRELAALHDVLATTSQVDASVEAVLRDVVNRIPAALQYPDLAEARIRLSDASYETPGFLHTDRAMVSAIRLAGDEAGEVRVVYREQPPVFEDFPFLEEEQILLDAIATHVGVFLARHRNEEGLRESRERYRVLAEFSSDWEYWLGPDGRYLYVSPACQAVTGHPAEAFLADPELLGRLVHPADVVHWTRHVQGRLADAASDLESVEFRLIARDGQERWIEHVCNPVIREDGRYLGRRGVNRDITDRKRFEEELKRSEAFLNATGRMAKVGGWELDPATHTMRWTRATHDLLPGRPGSALSREDWVACFHPEDRPKLRDALDRATGEGAPFDLQIRLDRPRGQQAWVQITCEPLVRRGGVVKLVGAIQDITARVEAEKSLRQAARVFESTAEGVMITDPDGHILAVNRAFTEITGYSEPEVLGAEPSMLRSGRHDEHFFESIWRELARDGQWRGELWNRHKDGKVYPVLLTMSAVLDGAGGLTHYVALFSDISQLKRSEEKLEFLATHDSLTGLPNRTLFQTRLEQCIQRAERYQRQFALLFIDLDRFKDVNDTLGHPFGDALLKQVALVLGNQVRAVDTIARLGGDEFVIILEDIPAAHFAARFADRLMEVFGQPARVLGRDLFITASIGISLYPQDGRDMDSLVRHADIAMYQAKNAGRNAFSFFEARMSEGVAQRLQLEHHLREALQRNEFILHYQPQLALDNRQLRGVETLCRWHHPQLGLMQPAQFLGLIEEMGLMDRFGFWVLEEGCRQLADWDRSGVWVPRLAVNLTVREIANRDLVSRIHEILEETGVAPERLELELPEGKLMRRAEASLPSLKALRDMGVTLAVDDFGAGYSSLAYLKRLPLNRLKIDCSFVSHLNQDPNDDAVVRAIIGLAHSLDLEVLAEGVETDEQADFLCREGCWEGQGFLFSQPVAAERIASAWSG